MILSLKKHRKLKILFEASSKKYEMICKYELYLADKLEQNEFSLSFIAKLLSNAINFLDYCKNFANETPTTEALQSYLWIHPNQKYNLNHLVEFLKIKYSIILDSSAFTYTNFERPKRSHQIYKKRLIKVLQSPNNLYISNDEIFRILIGYLHWIKIPQNVYLDKSLIEKKNNDYFINIHQYLFYLPKDLLLKLTLIFK